MTKYPIIELVVKIASRCNLNCTYCYEYNTGDDSWKRSSKFMSNDTAYKLGRRIQEHINEFNLNEFSIGLHGGEPLLMTPSKIDALVSTIKEQIDPSIDLYFGMQTNCMLLTSDHIHILKKHNIKVSVSLDGLEKTNDKYRVDLKGKPSWSKVIKGIDLLRTEAPELFIGLLSVIDIEANPIETFDFLAQYNVDIDFLLPLHTHDKPPFYPNNIKLAYGKWYFEIYKEWVAGRHSHLDVRFLKNIISQLLGGSAIYEVMTTSPIGLLTISTDGAIEGVDCLKVTGQGTQITGLNLLDNSFSDALDHELIRLRQSGVNDLHEKCKSCKFLYGCSGGYFPNRYSEKNGFNNPSIYCEDLYWLLNSIENDIKSRILNEKSTV